MSTLDDLFALNPEYDTGAMRVAPAKSTMDFSRRDFKLPNREPEPEVIFSYSRAEAIDDGMLIDAHKCTNEDLPRQAGFVCHVVFTADLWEVIEPSEKEIALGQSIKGRAWDVLNMLRYAIKSQRKDDNYCYFKTIFMQGPGRPEFVEGVKGVHYVHTEMDLLAITDGGDDGNQVITIGLKEDSGW